MAKAIWNGATLAESDRCQVVEGNQYFPPDAVRREYLRDSATHTACPWKGVASYYYVIVNGETNRYDGGAIRPQGRCGEHQGSRCVLARGARRTVKRTTIGLLESLWGSGDGGYV
jgi:hypothetical protein